jgi:hypothetical protein
MILLVVINRSIRDVCLESRFGSHIDTNYCAHKNFIKCLNISPCFPRICHILMFKLDDVMLSDLVLLVVTNRSMRDVCLES